MSDRPVDRAPESPWKASYFWMRNQRDEALALAEAAEARVVLLEAQRDAIAQVDDILDAGCAEAYQRQPLAQDWARIAKASEEVGEALAALIDWTGQNPRKPQRDEAREEMLKELADVALTGIYAMQHFTKDADETMERLWARLEVHRSRLAAVCVADSGPAPERLTMAQTVHAIRDHLSSLVNAPHEEHTGPLCPICGLLTRLQAALEDYSDA